MREGGGPSDLRARSGERVLGVPKLTKEERRLSGARLFRALLHLDMTSLGEGLPLQRTKGRGTRGSGQAPHGQPLIS